MTMYAIVFFPKDLPKKIYDFRKKYDFKWNLIQPHITLVFPFDFSDENLLVKHIEEKATTNQPFTIVVDRYKKSHDNYLYLTFKKGSSELIDLHNSLYTGVLTDYLKNDHSYEPHLTIGNFQNEDSSFQKEKYLQATRELELMPIQYVGELDSLTLIEIKDQLRPRRLVATVNFNQQ